MLVVQWCALPANILIIMFDFCSSLTPQHTVIDSCVDVCITMYLRMHGFRNKDSSKTTLAGKYLRQVFGDFASLLLTREIRHVYIVTLTCWCIYR